MQKNDTYIQYVSLYALIVLYNYMYQYILV